jgi:hypothetical protein
MGDIVLPSFPRKRESMPATQRRAMALDSRLRGNDPSP